MYRPLPSLPSLAVLPGAVAKGLLSAADIDRAVGRLLRARFRLGLFDPPGRDPFRGIPDAVVGRRLKPQDPGKPEDTRVLTTEDILALVRRLVDLPVKLGLPEDSLGAASAG